MNRLFESVYSQALKESGALKTADDFEDWHDFANWMGEEGIAHLQTKQDVLDSGIDYDSIVDELLPPFGDTFLTAEDAEAAAAEQGEGNGIGYDGSFYYIDEGFAIPGYRDRNGDPIDEDDDDDEWDDPDDFPFED